MNIVDGKDLKWFNRDMANSKVLTEADANYLEQRFSKVFVTKKDFQNFKSELFNRIDPILKEVVTAREERPLIENRLEALENIHPEGKHATVS